MSNVTEFIVLCSITSIVWHKFYLSEFLEIIALTQLHTDMFIY